MPDPKVSTIRMPDSMKSDLAAIARSHDMSVADAIAEALEPYITARKSEERFKERLARRLEQDREVLGR
jgi:hypothetical protein